MTFRATCAVLLWLALTWAFSPGIANPDTIGIIVQGITGNISDWHSPAASLFAGLAYPFGMPNGFLIVQTALAAGCACYLGALAWGAKSRRSLALSTVVVAVAAYTILLIVLAASQSIKDMWIVLLLASAGLLLYRSENPAAAIAATCLCAIAVLVRPVSIFPAAPLVAVAMLSLTRGFAGAVGATVVALISIWFLPPIFSAATNATRTSPASALFLYDIVGIAVRTPDPPGFIREHFGVNFTEHQLQDCYSPKTVEPFIWGNCPIKAEPPQMGMWLQTISHNPVEYMRHRFAFYPELLARIDAQMEGWVDRPMFQEAGSNSPKWIGRHALPPGVEISITGDGDNPILNALIDAQRFLSKGLGSPYAWTAISFAAIGLAWFSGRSFRSRWFLVVTAISLSSVANTVSFMLFSSYAGARYLGWSLVGATLAMALASISFAQNRTGTVADQDQLRA